MPDIKSRIAGRASLPEFDHLPQRLARHGAFEHHHLAADDGGHGSGGAVGATHRQVPAWDLL